MHCANCEVLIERRLKKIAGVRRVKVSHITGRAEINCYGDLDLSDLATRDSGRRLFRFAPVPSRAASRPTRKSAQNTSRDYVEIGAAFLILLGFYAGLGQLDLLPQNLSPSPTT